MPIEKELITPKGTPVRDAVVYDVAIIGGGLAGATSAYHLARCGLKTILFEKETGAHHKVCGEFISGEGIPLLEQMGIDLRALGASPMRQFRLHGPGQSGVASLPLPAYGLSREVLDEVVLAKARAAGAIIKRGVIVKDRSPTFDDPTEGARNDVLLDTTDGHFSARRLIVATGKYDFAGVGRRTGRDSGMVGFKMHVRLKPSALKRLVDHCDLFIFKGGYGGIAPIENGLANFCFLIDREILRKLKPTWSSLAIYIAKQNQAVSHYLDGAEPQFKNFVTVPRIPYGFIRNARPEPGVYCIGDQMAVIPSLTGDGMTIALRTGLAAAAAIASPEGVGIMYPPTTSLRYQKTARSALRTQIETAYLLHRLFKNPKLCDWAAYAIKTFPPVLDFLFSTTRCHLPGSMADSQRVLMS